jgi:ribosomal-protein-alanine N-acetyltransferase
MQLTGNRVKLREKSPDDVRNDYEWHRDAELAHLDGIVPTRLTFEQYAANFAREMRFFKTAYRHVFGIETLEGIHIGNCAFYDINEDTREAELGILIGNRAYWSRGYGADVVCLLVDYVFSQTRLRRLRLRTLEENIRAQVCFKKCGFIPYVTMETNGLSFVLMEITHRAWQKKQPGTETGAKK